MVTTVRQDRAFLTDVINPSLTSVLEEAISWISDNMRPEEVFSDKQLISWAEDNGYKKVEE